VHELETSVDCFIALLQLVSKKHVCRSKDDELTQLKVLAAEKDLALQTLQARTQELLERCGKPGKYSSIHRRVWLTCPSCDSGWWR
jgi:hypothetical protein